LVFARKSHPDREMGNCGPKEGNGEGDDPNATPTDVLRKPPAHLLARHRKRALRALKFQDAGKFSKAERMWLNVIEGYSGLVGDLDKRCLDARAQYVICLKELKRLDSLAEAQLKLAETYSRAHGEDHSLTLGVVAELFTTLVTLRSFASALPLGRLALKHRAKTQGKYHEDTLLAKKHLVLTYEACGNYQAAVDEQASFCRNLEKAKGKKHDETQRARDRLQALRDTARSKPRSRSNSLKRKGGGRRPPNIASPGTALGILEDVHYTPARGDPESLDQARGGWVPASQKSDTIPLGEPSR